MSRFGIARYISFREHERPWTDMGHRRIIALGYPSTFL
jgi:hypothetical protein